MMPSQDAPHGPANRSSSVPAPPRRLQRSAVIRLIFGGGLGQAGWLILYGGFALITPFLSVLNLPWALDLREKAEVVGQVTAIEETNVSINEETVSRVRYLYTVLGKTYTGESYGLNPNIDIKSNPAVPVLYVAAAPELSVLPGSGAGAGLWTIFLFPAAGAVMIVLRLWRAYHNAQMLRAGVITRAQLLRKEETNMTVNDQTVYKLTFRYADERGSPHTFVTRTHQPGALTDEITEELVYHPQAPTRAMLLDSLPFEAQFQTNGSVTALRPGELNLLMVPVLGLLVVAALWGVVL